MKLDEQFIIFYYISKCYHDIAVVTYGCAPECLVNGSVTGGKFSG